MKPGRKCCIEFTFTKHIAYELSLMMGIPEAVRFFERITMPNKVFAISLCAAAASIISTSALAFGVGLGAGAGAGVTIGGGGNAAVQLPLAVDNQANLQQAGDIAVKQELNASVHADGKGKQAVGSTQSSADASVRNGVAADVDARPTARRAAQAAAKAKRAAAGAVRSTARTASNASASGSVNARAGAQDSNQ